MKKNNIKNIFDQFAKRGIDTLQNKHNEALKQICSKLHSLNQFVKSRTDSMALSQWIDIDKKFVPHTCVLPDRIRYGTIQMLDSHGTPISGIDIPLLLSTKVNAFLFDLDQDADKVPYIFQNILLRLLLSMRMDLVKASIIDMDFGASFPIVSTITNPMFKNTIIYRQDDINRLIDELAKEISEANKNFLGRFSNIEEFNSISGEMAYPYHFVFIDDFPNGFTPQSVDELHRLIENGNASKAGIKIFLNYSKKNPQPRDFDYKKFAKKCACLTRGLKGHFVFENFNLRLPAQTYAQVELEYPRKVSDYVDFINAIKPRTTNYTLDGWIDNLKRQNRIWKESTINGIKVPIGYINPNKHFDFYLANDTDGTCNDFFALIAGRPGYGKTVLLHNIIVNAAMKYSPEELCLYLADFAEGASFSIYRELPHVKALMLANNKEYALRMLNDIVLEVKKRSHLYQKAQKQYGKQITKLSEYREVTKEILPRILFIMDEFHTLFLSTDNTTIRAKEELCNAIRQWRKFGISIILCTQSISGVNFGDADTHITYRFALNLLEMDSKSVIRNNAAMSLVRKGQTIMNNTADGNISMNVEFQSAFTTRYFEHVKYLAQMYVHKYKKKHIPYICESGVAADLADNKILIDSIVKGKNNVNHQYCDVFVGKPDLLRNSHTRIRYRRQLNSNTLILGDDYKTLIFNIMLQMFQIKYQSSINSKLYLIDCFNHGNPFKGALDDLTKQSNRFVLSSSPIEIAKCIKCLYDEMVKRKSILISGKMIEERVVFVILNAQDSYDLKSQQGRFGAEQSELSKMLIELLTEGGPLGIHGIVHALSYDTLFKTSGVLDSKNFSLFENLVLLKGADTNNLVYYGVKAEAPEEEGQMTILNAKIDGESYEQCNAYSDVTIKQMNNDLKFMSNIFDKYRYV